MDKEKILSQNKKENLYLDEYEKHIKLQGKSFGLMFVLFICILILLIKAVCKEPYYDIMTIIGSVAFGSMGYEAHISKNKSKFVIALFFLLANYAQTECQFRYCGTAIPFLTVRSTAR